MRMHWHAKWCKWREDVYPVELMSSFGELWTQILASDDEDLRRARGGWGSEEEKEEDDDEDDEDEEEVWLRSGMRKAAITEIKIWLRVSPCPLCHPQRVLSLQNKSLNQNILNTLYLFSWNTTVTESWLNIYFIKCYSVSLYHLQSNITSPRLSVQKQRGRLD